MAAPAVLGMDALPGAIDRPAIESILSLLGGLQKQLEKQGVQLERLGEQMERLNIRMSEVEKKQVLSKSPLSTSSSRGTSGKAGSVVGTSSETSPVAASVKSSGRSSPNSAPPLHTITYSTASDASFVELEMGSSRDLQPALQGKLRIHRLRTDLRITDFEYTAIDLFKSLVNPNRTMGLSLFVVASENPEATKQAHAVRGAVTKNTGCVSWLMSTLPAAFVLTIDRVLEMSIEGKPLVYHATLSPTEVMPWEEFCAALTSWSVGVVCIPRGAAHVEVEDDDDDEDDNVLDAKSHLSTFSESSAPYALAKLSAHAVALTQNAGGSPGDGY
jgi:hypothetical protein